MPMAHPDHDTNELSHRLPYLVLLLMLVPAFVACTFGEERAPASEENVPLSIELSSPAFDPGNTIPVAYSCDGDNISPPLQWRNVPQGTQSLALIMDDPDAPGNAWVHWVLYNIPAQTSELPENVAPADSVPGGGSQGDNSWNRVDYGGPCPPSGSHRYFFKLYALDVMLDLDAGATKNQLLAAMEGHILARGELMGTFPQ